MTKRLLLAAALLPLLVPDLPPPTPTAQLQSAGSLVLSATWEGYKHDFITSDGRVFDPMRDGLTTSEGESYALLRAVWMGDHEEFDLVWTWTQRNLLVPNGLHGFLSGARPDRSVFLVSQYSATDAEEDIALALLMAARRWSEPVYREAARSILTSIWQQEVANVAGRHYITAGDWAPWFWQGPALNPSYFAPYAYRVFAREDPIHPWGELVGTSYDALEKCTRAPLDARTSVGLPPDWCTLSADAMPHPYWGRAQADNYGYDAFRVMWRIALDYQWNREPRAMAYLKSSDFLPRRWHSDGLLAAVYRHDGSPAAGEELGVYGGDIGAFLGIDPAGAGGLTVKLLGGFRRADGMAYFDQRRNYYEQNWAWFGLALASGRLADLAG